VYVFALVGFAAFAGALTTCRGGLVAATAQPFLYDEVDPARPPADRGRPAALGVGRTQLGDLVAPLWRLSSPEPDGLDVVEQDIVRRPAAWRSLRLGFALMAPVLRSLPIALAGFAASSGRLRRAKR
jgi:hypothetical protein